MSKFSMIGCFLLAAAILVLMIGVTYATPPARPDDVLWSKTFDSDWNDSCLSVARTPDGGYVFAGRSYGADGVNAYAGRVNSNGSLLWRNLCPVKDSTFSVAFNTIDGNFTFVGTGRLANGRYVGYMQKTGQDGIQLLNKSYGADGAIWFEDAVQEADGSLVILGTIDNRTHINHTPAGGLFATVLKTDASGNPLGSMVYGSGNLECYGIARSPNGGYAITGHTFTAGSSITSGYMLEIDSTGHTLREINYTHAGDTSFNTLCNAGTDGYLLAGSIDAGNSHQIYMSRVAPNGTEIWNRTLDSEEIPYDVIQASDGGFVLACEHEVMKVDRDGFVEWQRTLGGTNDFLGSVVAADDGSYVFGGTAVADSGKRSTWLVDVGEKHGPGTAPGSGCWPMLVLPLLAISVIAVRLRRTG